MSALMGLIGRHAELERLRALLEPAGPTAMVIEGAAGVGKSRLLTELCESVGDQWHLELILGASALRRIPYGAVSHLLPQRSPTDPATVLATLRHVLLRRADGRPLLLAVDDGHALDDATATLIQQLVGRGEAKVVFTLRTGGLVPDPVVALWKDGATEIVEVPPLSERDTAAMTQEVLGGPIDPELRLAVWELSRGHPLYAVVALRSAVADGTVAWTRPRWRLHGDLATGHLTALIQARTRQLDPDAYAGLEVAAVAVPVLRSHLASLVEDDVIDRLVEEGLLTETGATRAPWLRPAHPLITDVVRRGLRSERLREISEQLVEVVGAGGARDDPDAPLRVAVWMLDADRPVDGQLLVDASREAQSRGDFALSERIAVAAIEDPAVAVAAGVLLARCMAFTGRAGDALHVLDGLHAQTQDDLIDVALIRSHVLAYSLGDPAAATQVLAHAGEGLTKEMRWQLDTHRSIYSAFAGDFQATFEAANAAIANPRTPGPSLTTAHVNLTLAQAMTGDITGLAEIVDRAAGLARDHREVLPLALDQVELAHASALLASGRFDESDELCIERLTQADGSTGPVAPAWLTWQSIAQGLRGRLLDAVALMDRALVLYEAADPFRLRAQASGLAALMRAQTGAPSASDVATVRTARAEASDETRLSIWVERGAAAFMAWSDPAKATAHVREHGIQAIERDHLVWGAWALYDAVRWGRADNVADDLGAAAARMRGADLVTLMSDHARALADRDVGRLETVATRLLETGALLFAGELFAHVHGLLLPEDPAAARRAALKAQILLGHCPGAMTPTLQTLQPALTPRELQIALDALEDRSSREISEARFLAVRTVDNHLYSIYRKLGVQGREQLRALLQTVLSPADRLESDKAVDPGSI